MNLLFPLNILLKVIELGFSTLKQIPFGTLGRTLVPKHAIVSSMCALTLTKTLKPGRTEEGIQLYSCVKEVFQSKLLLDTT